MSKSLDEARAMLPPRLHDTLDRMIAEYKFACLKHHGIEMVSTKVIAELILDRWFSVPAIGTTHFTANAGVHPSTQTKVETWCTCGLQQGEQKYCRNQACALKPDAAMSQQEKRDG